MLARRLGRSQEGRKPLEPIKGDVSPPKGTRSPAGRAA